MRVVKCAALDIQGLCNAKLVATLSQPDIECWSVGKAPEAVVGIMVRTSGEYMKTALEIKVLYVMRPEQGLGKGYRSALLQHVCDRARDLGLCGVIYVVGSTEGGGTEQLVPFLEHKGFRQHPRYHTVYIFYVETTSAPTRSPPQETGRIFRVALAHGELKSMMQAMGGKRKDARPNSPMYASIAPGDTMQYYAGNTQVNMLVWRRVNYPTFRDMLSKEGVSTVLSTHADLGHAVKFYHRIPGYTVKEGRFGVSCFHLLPMTTPQKRTYELRVSDHPTSLPEDPKRNPARYTTPPL